jgi:hypothetical protein
MMTGEKNTYYEELLIELEADRQELDRLIKYVRRRLGAASNGEAPPPRSSLGTAGTEQAIPRNAFSGMSMPEAVKAYLSAMNQRQNPKQVMEGLQRGGFHTTAKNVYASVYTTLIRLEKAGEAVKFDTGEWGLSDWYPSMRRDRGRREPSTQDTESKEESQ